MKNILVMLLLFISLITAFTSAIPIEDAKNMKDYNWVEIEGTVTSIPGSFENNIFFVQDGTAGINVYGKSVDFSVLNIKMDQRIYIKGMMYTHRQNREITVENKDAVVILGNAVQVSPMEISTSDVNKKENQGLLVKTSGKIIDIDFPKIYIDDGSGETMVYIRENTGIGDYFAEDVYATFCGVIGKYDNEVELWPRSSEDVEITDLIPPEILFVKVVDDNTLNLFFNEELGEFIPELNKTVKIKEVEISGYEFTGNRTLTLKVSGKLPDNGEIFIKGVKDKSGNITLLRKKAFSSGDVYVLFDEGHGQGAGNADWTVDGGFSDFAEGIEELGYKVFSTSDKFDYELLDNFDILILSEPNKPYETHEISVIENFTSRGGGVLFIADHGGADRNGNGWDAVKVFNVFAPDFLNIRFNSDDLEQFETTDIFDSPFTQDVNSIAVWNGCSIETLDDSVKTAVTVNGKKYVVYGNIQNGRFIAIGDSSPFDDGSGEAGKMLYNGYFMHDIEVFSMNAIRWLASE